MVGWVVGGGWGLQSYFHVQPNYSVEVVLLVVLFCCWGSDNKLFRIGEWPGGLITGSAG